MATLHEQPLGLSIFGASPTGQQKSRRHLPCRWAMSDKMGFLEAEMSALFAVLTGGTNHWHFVPTTQAFGTITSTSARRDMIAKAAEAFFLHMNSVVTEEYLLARLPKREKELKAILAAYAGWTARRNDVAHGCVTESEHPDYEIHAQPFSDDTPLISTFSLCPSHGNSRKWHVVSIEPAYHYVAHEIAAFTEAFDSLAKRVSDFSANLDQWLRKSPRETPNETSNP
jgi:hypothetical protein